MAKKGTFGHPKVKRLARALNTIPGIAWAIVTTIIDQVNEYHKDGALTRVDIEDALDAGQWLTLFSTDEVIAAMTDKERECVWLDPLPDGRFYLHDYHEHAEDFVKMALMRAHAYFANGVRPSCTRMEHKERTACDKWFDDNPFEGCAQREHGVYTPSPPLPSLPIPSQALAIPKPMPTQEVVIPEGEPCPIADPPPGETASLVAIAKGEQEPIPDIPARPIRSRSGMTRMQELAKGNRGIDAKLEDEEAFETERRRQIEALRGKVAS